MEEEQEVQSYSYTYKCVRCPQLTTNKLRTRCHCGRAVRLIWSNDPDNQPKPVRLQKRKEAKPQAERIRSDKTGKFLKRAG